MLQGCYFYTCVLDCLKLLLQMIIRLLKIIDTKFAKLLKTIVIHFKEEELSVKKE